MNAKKSSGPMYLIWSAAIVVCLFVVLFSLLFASCSSDGKPKATPTAIPSSTASSDPDATPDPDATADPNATPTPSTAPTAAVSAVQLPETEDAGQAFIDKLTFLGDSTTYGLKAYEVLADGKQTTQVWTPSSGTLTLSNQSTATIVYPETGEEITIVKAVEAKKPEYLVITLGVNGVSFMDEDYFKQEYKALVESVQKASPDTKIICNSIYPVESDYEHIDTINNEKITAANGWIQAVAEECGVKYWDSASVLKGDDGFLKESYGNGDGIHLSGEGFMQVLNYMRTHAYL